MVASLVLTGQYNVGLNSNGKTKVDGHLLSLTDIPFVRYRFGTYAKEQYEYILKNMEKFKDQIHLIEMNLEPGIVESIEAFHSVFDPAEKSEKIAKFLYISVDDEVKANGLSEETINLLKSVSEEYFDRIMLKDNTTELYEIAADRIKIQIENALDGLVSSRDIGICGSPLSFRSNDTEGQACLTAVWARKIMSEYAENPDITIPSASHECMTCCGCTRYFVISEDIPAPLSSKEKAANNKDKPKKSGSDTKVKVEKTSKALAAFNL